MYSPFWRRFRSSRLQNRWMDGVATNSVFTDRMRASHFSVVVARRHCRLKTLALRNIQWEDLKMMNDICPTARCPTYLMIQVEESKRFSQAHIKLQTIQVFSQFMNPEKEPQRVRYGLHRTYYKTTTTSYSYVSSFQLRHGLIACNLTPRIHQYRV